MVIELYLQLLESALPPPPLFPLRPAAPNEVTAILKHTRKVADQFPAPKLKLL